MSAHRTAYPGRYNRPIKCLRMARWGFSNPIAGFVPLVCATCFLKGLAFGIPAIIAWASLTDLGPLRCFLGLNRFFGRSWLASVTSEAFHRGSFP